MPTLIEVSSSATQIEATTSSTALEINETEETFEIVAGTSVESLVTATETIEVITTGPQGPPGSGGTGSITSVKSAPYNAVGDGVADDTAAIQAALDSLPTTGGAIYIPQGRYKITAPLTVTSDATSIFGAGAGQRVGATQNAIGTRLEIGAGFVGTEVLRVSKATGNNPLYGALLRDFTIDGGLVGTVDGILFRSNRALIDHVHVHKMGGAGIRVKGYSSPNFDTYDTTVAFCQVGDCAAEGVFFDTDAADDHLIGCVLFNNNHNFRLAAASAQVTGNHFYNATTNNILIMGGGSRTKFSNNKIEGSGSHGVNIDSTNGGFSDIQFVGNQFKNSGDAANNTADHLIIQGPSSNGVTRTMITGNVFSHQSSASANKPRYAVNLSSSGAQGGTVVGNTFGPADHWGTAPIRDATPLSNKATIGWNNGAVSDGTVFNWDPINYTAEQRFNGDLVLQGLRIPTGVTVTPSGTLGTTTYSYRVSALTALEETLASVAVQITNGNAVLTNTDSITVAWASVTGAESYNVYGRTAAGEQFISNVKATTFTDDGTLTPVAPTAASLVAPTGQQMRLKLWENQSSSPLVMDDHAGVRVWRINQLGELAWADALGATDVTFGRGATKRLDCSGGIRLFETTGRAFVEFFESSSAPITPPVNAARLFSQDSSGKTQLAVRFNTGASVVLATEGETPLKDPQEDQPILPTGFIRSTIPRNTHSNGTVAALVSGRMSMVAIRLEAGEVITNVSFFSGGTAMVTPTNWWFALYDPGLNLLRQTADQLTAAWTGTTVKTLALSSPYTVPTTGTYYLAIMVAATTVPTLTGHSAAGNVMGMTGFLPILSGSSSTGLTTTAPATAAALTVISGNFMGLVS